MSPTNRTCRMPSPAPPPRTVGDTFCVVGDTLCHYRVFSETRWEQIAPAERPTPAERYPGLGWVAAVSGHTS